MKTNPCFVSLRWTLIRQSMEWKSEYAVIFFLVFVGAGFSMSKQSSPVKVSVFRMIVSQMGAVMFGGLVLIGIFIIWWNTHVFFPFVLAIPVGILADKFLTLYMEYGTESKGFLDFVSRMGKGYRAFKEAETEIKKESQQSTLTGNGPKSE